MNMLVTLYLAILMSVEVFPENIIEENVNSDPVIDLFLNGGNATYSDETTDDAAILMSGIWKCGNCTNIDDSQIVYSEENYIEADDNDDDGDAQIELVLDGMRCVTVSADKPGVVKRLTGACDGAVTLHVKPSRRFIVQIYV